MSRVPRLLLLLACLIALPVSAQSTPTAPPLPTLVGDYIVAQDIYVRGGPGETYLPVGRLIEGVTVIPVNISADGSWVLIRYSRGFGWIRRDLALWTTEIDALPVLDESDLTPTVIATETPTPRPTGIRVEAGDLGAYIRVGPGVDFPHLGAVLTGNYVEPVGQNPEGTWILIRFRGGFGWVARSLLSHDEPLGTLPILQMDALTPSPTLPPSETPTITFTPSMTETPSPTLTATLIPTNTPVFTATNTPTLVPSATLPPSDTPTLIPTNTRTFTPSRTSTDTFTPTNTATATATSTFTETNTTEPPTATDTVTPTYTYTPVPSNTPTPTQTFTATYTATFTPTEVLEATAEITAELLPTETATHTATTAPTHMPSEPAVESTVELETTEEIRVTPAINAGLDQRTQTRTFTPRPTRTISRTPTERPTSTPSITATETLTNTPTSTSTLTSTPTDTSALISTATASSTATDTLTPRPTATTQPSSTAAEVPAETEAAAPLVAAETLTSTRTPHPSRTPTETDTPTTRSATRVPAQTDTPTQVTLSAAATEAVTAEASPVLTVLPSASNTAAPSRTPSETPVQAVTSTPTPSNTPTTTQGAAPAVVLPTPVSGPAESGEPPRVLPPEALVGAVLVALVITYIGFYWRGLTVADRYTDGFVIDRCPVCHEGHLHVEMRRGWFLGIPRPRYSVRCDNCRSVLREAGTRRWRYAVDPTANPPIYNRFNGRVVDEPALRVLESQAIAKRTSEPQVRPPGTPPTFVDDEE